MGQATKPILISGEEWAGLIEYEDEVMIGWCKYLAEQEEDLYTAEWRAKTIAWLVGKVERKAWKDWRKSIPFYLKQAIVVSERYVGLDARGAEGHNEYHLIAHLCMVLDDKEKAEVVKHE